MTEPVRITELTWPEYRDRITDTPIIVPIGATEQHGHHLPLGCDAIHATFVAEEAAKLSNTLVAPTLNYGYKSNPKTGGGEIFPGTVSLDASTLIATIRDIMTQLMDDGARKILVLSGHYENTPMINEGIDLSLRGRKAEGAKVLNLLWPDLISDQTLDEIYPGEFPSMGLEHAAFLETSIMLHLRPELVHIERAGTEIAEFPPYDVHPQVEGFVPSTGSLTRSAGSTAAHGKRMLDECVAELAHILKVAWD
jgi:creatinine amidohydrolase